MRMRQSATFRSMLTDAGVGRSQLWTKIGPKTHARRTLTPHSRTGTPQVGKKLKLDEETRWQVAGEAVEQLRRSIKETWTRFDNLIMRGWSFARYSARRRRRNSERYGAHHLARPWAQ
jgi:hypothetical protein